MVCGGAQTVIEAIMETVGDEGSIMMPAQSWKNLDPDAGVHWTVGRKYWQIIRDNWPAYDKSLPPPIQWVRWLKCFACGKALSEAIIRQDRLRHGERMPCI